MLPDLIPRPHPGPDEVPYCACCAEPVAGEHQKQAENAYARHNKLLPWRRPLPTDSSKLLGRLVTLQTTRVTESGHTNVKSIRRSSPRPK
jgi:hypothetical protein